MALKTKLNLKHLPIDLTKVEGRHTTIPCHRDEFKLVSLASAEKVDHAISEFVRDHLIWDLQLANTTLLPILEGGAVFHTDILRELGECRSVASNSIKASRYHSGLEGGDVSLFPLQLEPDLIRDRHVVIIDDILDTGETALRAFKEVEKLKPLEITTVFLTRKVGKRQVIEPDYWLFEIDPRVWAVGRGMDYRYQLRQLRGILDLHSENYDRQGRRIR